MSEITGTESGKGIDARQWGGGAKFPAIYLLVLAVGVGLFFVARKFGMGLEEGAAPGEQNGSPLALSIDTLTHVLLALSVIILVTRFFGVIFSWIRQPAVIGEIFGGIMLGPTLLGHISPETSAYLIPASVMPFLMVIAQLGIILYMFLVGLELDLSVVRRSGHMTLLISHASIVAPFVLGSFLALGLYGMRGDGANSFTVFALFIGVSVSVTAFPVLARILSETGMNKTRIGAMALTAAAIDDVTAWCLLALVVSFAEERAGAAVRTILLTLGFIAVIFLVVRPLVRRFVQRLDNSSGLNKNSMALVFIAMLLSSLATEFIGIHAIFGAFLLGAAIPHTSRIAEELISKLEVLIGVLFLPIFFAFTGMRTQVGLLASGTDWLICGAIVAVACAGKFGGTSIMARWTGLSWRDASVLGILMNTRGLVELIVLNIGLDLGVISPRLFAMLVIMALVTTFMTSPILRWLNPEGLRAQSESTA